jgi:hypothetical protein
MKIATRWIGGTLAVLALMAGYVFFLAAFILP